MRYYKYDAIGNITSNAYADEGKNTKIPTNTTRIT